MTDDHLGSLAAVVAAFGEDRAWTNIEAALHAHNARAVRRPSTQCSAAVEDWHDNLSSFYYRGDCCDHAPLGPTERKSILYRQRQMMRPAPASSKPPARGY